MRGIDRHRHAPTVPPLRLPGIIIHTGMVGSQVSQPHNVSESPKVQRWHRRLVTALACLWIIDGLLQLQPSMYSRGVNGFLANVLQYNTMGRPNPLTDLIRWSVTLTYGTASHQVVFNTLAALVQLGLGIAMLAKRTQNAALLASAVWAVVPWVVGEAMGQMLFPQASMAFVGTPGAALIYLFLSLTLLHDQAGESEPATSGGDGAPAAEGHSSHRTESSCVAEIGVAGPRFTRGAWALVWLGSAIFEIEFSNWAPNSISAQFGAAASREPGLIGSMDRLFSHLLAGHGTIVALLMAVVQAWVGAAVLRPELRRIALGAGIVVSMIYWVAFQNFGGIFTGNATDLNLGPVMVAFALALWPLEQAVD